MWEPEQSWIIVGIRRGRLWIGRRIEMWIGNQSSVAFDWRLVLSREEQRGDVLGWYHTHPVWGATPSKADTDTMWAWTDCLGKDLLCVIEGRHNGLTETLAWRFSPRPNQSDVGRCGREDCDLIQDFYRFGNVVVGYDNGNTIAAREPVSRRRRRHVTS